MNKQDKKVYGGVIVSLGAIISLNLTSSIPVKIGLLILAGISCVYLMYELEIISWKAVK